MPSPLPGADAHARNNGDSTPLHSAVLHSQIECARALIAAGADAHLADEFGDSALSLARRAENAPMAELLRRTIAVNGFDGRTTVHEIALGQERGTATLEVPKNEPKNAHVVQGKGGPGTVEVPLRRGDEIPGALDADFIKIDAEGAEQAIWTGLADILVRNRPLTILLEFAAARYADPAAFLSQILSHGFDLAEVDLVGGVQPRSPADVLNASPHDDQMLLLTRS